MGCARARTVWRGVVARGPAMRLALRPGSCLATMLPRRGWHRVVARDVVLLVPPQRGCASRAAGGTSLRDVVSAVESAASASAVDLRSPEDAVEARSATHPDVPTAGYRAVSASRDLLRSTRPAPLRAAGVAATSATEDATMESMPADVDTLDAGQQAAEAAAGEAAAPSARVRTATAFSRGWQAERFLASRGGHAAAAAVEVPREVPIGNTGMVLVTAESKQVAWRGIGRHHNVGWVCCMPSSSAGATMRMA